MSTTCGMDRRAAARSFCAFLHAACPSWGVVDGMKQQQTAAQHSVFFELIDLITPFFNPVMIQHECSTQ
jgi:hypothetical protein